MGVIDNILIGVAVVVLLPVTVYTAECLVAFLLGIPPALRHAGMSPAVAVVIPAHNEEQLIGATVGHVRAQLKSKDAVYVVADNCTDSTAEAARSAGAIVWPRTDLEHRGKGYAISFAVEKLSASPPDIVVLVDADCRLSDGLIDSISCAAFASKGPVQSQYRFYAPAGSGSLAQISAFACLVRNLVRPSGMQRLGVPCHLTGSGMAFPWQQLREAPAQHGNIVEDLALGLELALTGNGAILSARDVVTSPLPMSGDAAKAQRRRWEHGQLATLISYTPRLLSRGIMGGRPSLVALAADLSVPPLALLVTIQCLVLAVSGCWLLLTGNSLPFYLAVIGLVLILVATLLAWIRFGREVISGWTLLGVPFYVLWKLPLYLSFLFRRQQQDWIRTQRDVRRDSSPDKRP